MDVDAREVDLSAGCDRLEVGGRQCSEVAIAHRAQGKHGDDLIEAESFTQRKGRSVGPRLGIAATAGLLQPRDDLVGRETLDTVCGQRWRKRQRW